MVMVALVEVLGKGSGQENKFFSSTKQIISSSREAVITGAEGRWSAKNFQDATNYFDGANEYIYNMSGIPSPSLVHGSAFRKWYPVAPIPETFLLLKDPIALCGIYHNFEDWCRRQAHVPPTFETH
jgi:hypothetical protein